MSSKHLRRYLEKNRELEKDQFEDVESSEEEGSGKEMKLANK